MSPLLRVLGWKGTEAPRVTAGGLATLVPGPEAHRDSPGEGLGGAATRGGGPGPRAGSSAIVSRPHREEPVLCMEKGRVSVDEMERSMLDTSPTDSAHGAFSSQVPPCAHSCPPPCPLALLLLGLGVQTGCAPKRGPQGPQQARAHRSWAPLPGTRLFSIPNYRGSVGTERRGWSACGWDWQMDRQTARLGGVRGWIGLWGGGMAQLSAPPRPGVPCHNCCSAQLRP